MKRIVIAGIVCLGWLPCIVSAETYTLADVEKLFREALRQVEEDLMSEENLGDLMGNVEPMLKSIPEGDVNRDAVRLTKGMALLRANQPEKALEALSKIQGFDKESERVRQRNLTGVAHYQLADNAKSGQNWSEAKQHSTDAVKALTNALMIDPSSETVRENLELALKQKQTIEELAPPPQQNDQEEQEQSEEEHQQKEDSQENQEGEEQQQDEQSGEQPETAPTPEPEESGGQEDGEGSEESQPEAEPTPSDTDQQDSSSGEEGEETDETSEAQAGAGEMDGEEREMSRRQAEEVLDTYLEQEKRQRRQYLEQRIRPVPVEKDW